MDAGNTPASFEEAMERLEIIVGQMESGDLPLEEILTRYEEGTRLVRDCTARLSAAEKRIELIARNAAGAPEVVPFDASAAQTVEATQEEPPSSDALEESPQPPRKTRPSRATRPPVASEPPEDVSLF